MFKYKNPNKDIAKRRTDGHQPMHIIFDEVHSRHMGIDLVINKDKTNTSKPPLGIEPRELHDEARQHELISAIYRYINANKEIPIQWIEEYNNICTRYGTHPQP